MYCLFPWLQSKRFINRVPSEFKNNTLLVFNKLHMNVFRIHNLSQNFTVSIIFCYLLPIRLIKNVLKKFWKKLMIWVQSSTQIHMIDKFKDVWECRDSRILTFMFWDVYFNVSLKSCFFLLVNSLKFWFPIVLKQMIWANIQKIW